MTDTPRSSRSDEGRHVPTVDEAIVLVEQEWLDNIANLEPGDEADLVKGAPEVLASEVRRLREEIRSNICAASAFRGQIPAAPLSEQQPFVKIGILHRRRNGEIDFLQEIDILHIGLHETMDVYTKPAERKDVT